MRNHTRLVATSMNNQHTLVSMIPCIILPQLQSDRPEILCHWLRPRTESQRLSPLAHHQKLINPVYSLASTGTLGSPSTGPSTIHTGNSICDPPTINISPAIPTVPSHPAVSCWLVIVGMSTSLLWAKSILLRGHLQYENMLQ